MPEIKNTFLQGKMNKDLDERLIPNGQYRDAWNVEVSTAEDSSVGTVKNILGNKRVDESMIPSGFKCVGSIANEQTNKLYWFVSSYDKDAIIEYDVENDVTSPILVDLHAGTYKAVLKFGLNIITGINIIDDLLFWTDNNSDPKKINIEECRKGTPIADGNGVLALESTSTVHTQLLFENGSFDGITIGLVSPWSGFSAGHDVFFDGSLTQRTGRYAWFETKQLEALLGENIGLNSTLYTSIRLYRNGEYLGVRDITVSHDTGGTRIWWRGPEAVSQGNQGAPGGGYLIDNHKDLAWHLGDIIFGNGIKIDIEERHITVIKPKPLNAFSVKINHTQNLDSTSNIPNLFETKFPRFSYRYKYRDGEFSAFAPFTNPVFNPKYTKDPNKSSATNVFYDKNTAYDIKDPQNKAMVNSIHSVELTDFITAQTPEDVVEVDILYKQEDSPVIYSVGTIKHLDSEWHSISNHEGLGLDLGLGKSTLASGSYFADGGFTKGKYIVTTENIYAALPANQLLRPWDNVPRKALAQEIVGNRIVYGNYLQNYNMGVLKPKIKVSYSDRSNQIGSFSTQGLPSIKSQRTYRLGVIYSDKYGRETPVFTSNEGAISIPWQEGDGTKNASKSLQLIANVSSNFPEWVDSLKFFVKETSNEYYNLVMDKAWVTKTTYELDNSEGHLWISFPSSDRNKISEEDYIILKKKVGTGEEQINFENKFKVIDIKNEAPDAIKYELVNLGVKTNNTSDILTSGGNALFTTPSSRIDKEVNIITIQFGSWKSHGGYRGALEKETVLDSTDNSGGGDVIKKNLYLSWRRLDSTGVGVSSKKYKVISGWKGTGGYVLSLSTPITKIDADIAHVNGDSSTAETHMHQNLIFQVEEKRLKDTEDFSGKFFVKISKNQITDLIESGEPVSLLDQYQITSKTPSWYWQDDVWTNFNIIIDPDGSPTGSYSLANWYGHDQNPGTGVNSILNGQNNDVGPITADYKTLRVTDWYRPWDGILSKFGPTFFVDAMHVASGQSEASNYAKYNCILWAGNTEYKDNANSSWSYPPLKTWLTDFTRTVEFLDSAVDTTEYVPGTEGGSIAVLGTEGFETSPWFEGNLISTSPEIPDNTNWNNLGVDGWVGSLQNVDRDHHAFGIGYPTPFTQSLKNQVNGLEGFVTTNSVHAIGPRRWFSGITGNKTEHGVGVDTKTYSDNNEVGRHFMHLSFFAPGKDLHDGDWTGVNGLTSGLIGGKTLYGINSFAANLQGIWGGGHFTGESPDDKFGTDVGTGGGHFHLCMEGNNAADDSFLPETPGPGVGYGYDLTFRELHERQWDPTFCEGGDPDNKIRDFIRNLHAGSQFKFSRDTPTGSAEVYTIKKVVIKKLYNHTSWRKPYNRYINGGGDIGVDYGYIHTDAQNLAYRSVEQLGLEWLNELDDDANGGNTVSNNGITYLNAFASAIVNFGKASNRRLCYIIELDKNPTAGPYYNPIADDDHMSADSNNGVPSGGDFTNIEFLDPVQSVLLSDLSKFPAIWEVDPKKREVDLDIYYEVSGGIPININSDTNELFAPLGCKVEVLNSSITSISRLLEWDGTIATFEPGFPRGNGVDEIDYTGMSFKFTREDGGFTIAEAGGQQLIGENTGKKTTFGFRGDVGDNIRAGLSWYNCFSFGNGLESNRINDDFNEMFITNGVKASTTIQETYEEERRSHGLIYSGIYNSNSGVNDLNQFIMAEKSTKDLNPTYGSIQKLFQRRISLIAFCEDRVISITSNKDAIYNADGSPQLISSSNVLGDANPFVGEYGISKNPESFTSESYRAYFTDKQRGAVLRLSKDGLTPISKAGMHDWFRDNLSKHTSLIGTYDSYKEDYNVTLSDAFSENIIYDSFLESGVESTQVSGGVTNKITNPGVSGGNNFVYPWEHPNNIDDTNFLWGSVNEELESTVDVTNHAAISVGELQPLQQQVDEELSVLGPPNYAGTGAIGSPATYYVDPPNTTFQTGETITQVGVLEIPFASAIYSTTLPNSVAGGSLTGQFYTPTFEGNALHIWGPNASNTLDSNIYSTVRRYMNNVYVSSSGWVDESSPYSPNLNKLHVWGTGTTSGANGAEYTWANYPVFSLNSAVIANEVTGVISRSRTGSQYTVSTPQTGSILFDRVYTTGGADKSWVEFSDLGAGYNMPWGINETYVNNSTAGQLYASSPIGTQSHSSFYNGDEIHIAIEIKCYATLNHTSGGNLSGHSKEHGYNVIEPQIQLFDGGTAINNDKFVSLPSGAPPFPSGWGSAWQGNQGTYKPYEFMQSSIISTGMSTTAGMGGAYSVSTSGISTDYEDMNFLNWKDSSTVIWDSTGTIDTLHDTTAGTITSGDTKTITLGCSFKFRDPNQQDASGAYTDQAGNHSAGDGIEEKKVVNDLRIRINQIHDPNLAPSGFPTTAGGILKRPLWEINNIKIVKGFGVTGPHQEFVPEVPELTQPINTTYSHSIGDTATGPPSPVVTIPPGLTFPLGKDGIPGNYAEILPSYTTYVAPIHYVAPVPPAPIPAWTEVNHNNSSWFEDWSLNASGYYSSWLHAHEFFGNNYPSAIATGYYQNPIIANAPTASQEFTYIIPGAAPAPWSPGPTGGSPFGTAGYSGGGSLVTGTTQKVYHNNDYLRIYCNAGTAVNIEQWISNDPWQQDKWYLVDVEYDESFNPNTGTGGGNGTIQVHGVASMSGYSPGNVEISSDGVGTYSGGYGAAHCRLVPTLRTEYGSTRTVLRGIFKFDSNSYRNGSPSLRDHFVLQVWSCTTPIRIEKIISRKLDTINTTGEAHDWYRMGGWGTTQTLNHLSIHSFDKPELYWKGGLGNNKLCFDIRADQTNNHHKWVQDFNTPNTLPAPEITPLGWRLNFTVSNNPDTNDFVGKLRGWVARIDAGYDHDREGLYFYGIDSPGEYEIKFNMHGDPSNIGSIGVVPSLGPWTIEKDGVDYSGTATAVAVNPAMSSGWSAAIVGDKISFMDGTAAGTSDVRMAVSNIVLTDETVIFQGGSAGSWNFDGFNTSVDKYIFWEQYDPSSQDGRLFFNYCPAVDPNATTLPPKLINVNQWIDNATPIDRYEKYRIEFTHGISSGKLSIYYFNSEGYGFKIQDIDSTAGLLVGTGRVFDQIVTIGDQMWESINSINSTYAPDLKESFVIGLYDESTNVSGWMDNISMTRVYELNEQEEKTITFSEDVNGWTSFKNFVPENGLSLSKKYFTIEDGGLFQHYVPLKRDGNSWVSCNEDVAENYNIFYNDPYGSSVKIVLNGDPSTIKTFNTLNYEGSQAYVVKPLSVFDPTVIDPVTGQPLHKLVNINNADAWNSGSDIDGWNCTEIKTDMDTGTVVEFIKKEGKWFNYIKGKTVSSTGIEDTSRFSVQGVGVVSGVTSLTI